MERFTKWYRRSESRIYLQLILLFTALYWLFTAKIYIGNWGWVAVSAQLAVLIWIYLIGRQLPGKNALGFLFNLFLTYHLPSYIKEEIEQSQWVLALFHSFLLLILLENLISTLNGYKSRVKTLSQSSSDSVTIPQFCLVMIGFFLFFAYLINYTEQPFHFPVSIDPEHQVFTLFFLISGVFFIVWLGMYYLCAFFLFLWGRRKVERRRH